MTTKILATAAILLVIPGVALASPFEDSFMEDSSDGFFDDPFFADDSQEEDIGDIGTVGCNGLGVGEAATEVSSMDSNLNIEGKYCANTGGYSVASETVNVQGDTVDVQFQLQSPAEDQIVTQAITAVDYSVEESLEQGDYSVTYEVLLDGETIDSGEEEIGIGSSSDDSFFSDSFFDDDFFGESSFDDPGAGDSESDESETDESDSGDSESGDSDTDESEPGDSEESDSGDSESGNGESDVSEEAFIQEAPEQGDPYFEAETDDWVSYVNPRDEYHPDRSGRDNYPGSGKICMVLLNEAGEPIVGETLPDTQASMDTDGLEWHSHANPFIMEFPLTENYDRPLDSDQFGVSDDLPQGDGLMDSHCLEAHLLHGDETIEYDQVQITGENADDVEVVGYYDQLNTWNSDFDPINDVSEYGSTESSDGSVTMSPGNTHFQILAVLQLDRQ